MIDDPKKEEDLNEEIEVEIDEEGHTESPSEEQPAPEPETPETEKEEEELDEEPEKEEDSTEPESEEEESDDKKVYGKRAEKRIKRLVKQRKELQEKLEALEAEKQKFQEEREELAGRTAESELEAVKQYGNRLKAQEKEILATLKDAKAQGDVDREIEATDKLASVKAEALIVKQYEQRAGRTSTTKKVSAEETAKKLEEKVAVPDRRAVQWQKRNSWFGGNDQSQKIMTQAAMVIHKELIEEGVYPDADPDEYYSELDARIRTEFPEKFKAEKSAKKVQVVAGGTRTSPSGKQKVTLSKSEVETANKLGVSLQDYAKQKMRRDQTAG
jgi:putative NIF3 family GTP cyclohydrolase 1 type 2